MAQDTREALESALGFETGALELRKDEISEILTSIVTQLLAGESPLETLLQKPENPNAKQHLHQPPLSHDADLFVFGTLPASLD